MHFFRQRNRTNKILFWKNVSLSNYFLTSVWIVPDPQWHFSKVSSKSNFLFPKKYFELKYVFQAKKVFVSFLNFEQTIFGLSTRSVWERFSELQLLVHSNVFMKNIFFENRVFFHTLLLILGGTFPGFWLNFTAELTKVHFICPKEQLMEKKLIEKIDLTQ